MNEKIRRLEQELVTSIRNNKELEAAEEESETAYPAYKCYLRTASFGMLSFFDVFS
jgi:hypothetical protein